MSAAFRRKSNPGCSGYLTVDNPLSQFYLHSIEATTNCLEKAQI